LRDLEYSKIVTEAIIFEAENNG